MTDQIYATPKTGLAVPKPDGGVLAEGGEIVAAGMYWLRREADGDVTLSPPKAPAKRAPKEGVKQPVKGEQK